ncbi:Zn-ribbon domain-containing OB-fold protein [Puniceibacterium sp. IMCC21224]|uniref:Zn-ribbon domain-containing OB-fold protein n=1 Tax=Puniceibacterium sp. IMCC21224 TaxID=1618204 RepID=UPI00065DA900|nr:OB-fold domain-containing protein [Puniceibacterium sp. IMCC21224]KMK64928.1 putative nucleic-acid-binding protein containing a Zn-ribbon [Puniceibacterium sp. IMCC21224]
MQTTKTPPRILGLYDVPMWTFLEQDRQLRLQCCTDCGTWRYPPGPACPDCLSPDSDWKPVSGQGEVVSWVMFHKEYLPEYPAPYNVVAVRLDEGPILISNLIEDPAENVIGKRVKLVPVEMDDGVVLPRFELESA